MACIPCQSIPQSLSVWMAGGHVRLVAATLAIAGLDILHDLSFVYSVFFKVAIAKKT